MKKIYVYSYRLFLFLILILLTSSMMVEIIKVDSISSYKKILILGINIVFLCMLLQFIETYIYCNYLKIVLHCKMYTALWVYKIIYVIVPFICILLYAIILNSFISVPESVFTGVGILIIGCNNTYMQFIYTGRASLIFANEKYIFLYDNAILWSSVKEINICKQIKNTYLIDVDLILHSGEKYTKRIDAKDLNELCELMYKENMKN